MLEFDWRTCVHEADLMLVLGHVPVAVAGSGSGYTKLLEFCTPALCTRVIVRSARGAYLGDRIIR